MQLVEVWMSHDAQENVLQEDCGAHMVMAGVPR